MKILVIITGSNGGIGKELKLQYFNDKKYLVMGVDLESKNSLENEHYFLMLDFSKKFTISRQAKILNKIKHIKNKNNLKKIILINNAAVQIIKPIQNVELNDIEESISVNLTYPMMLSKLLLRVTSPKDLKIFNVSSIHSKLTKSGFSLYALSKSALDSLTKSLNIEFAHRGLIVNSISPAAIETSMLKKGFSGKNDKLLKLKKFHPTKSIGSAKDLAIFIKTITQLEQVFLSGAKFEYDGGISNLLHDPN